MAHEILSVKLCELEDQLSRLGSRIHLSETAGHERLQREIKELTMECAEAELTLLSKLQLSRADMVSVLYDAYGKIEQLVRKTKDLLQKQADSSTPDIAAEEKILLAEYALDFAAQAANQALLLAMEAIDAQLMQEERRTS